MSWIRGEPVTTFVTLKILKLTPTVKEKRHRKDNLCTGNGYYFCKQSIKLSELALRMRQEVYIPCLNTLVGTTQLTEENVKFSKVFRCET